MTDLQEALRELADGHAPAGPPADLWSRGVRRRRLRRSATVLAVTAVVLAGTGVGALVQRTGPEQPDVAPAGAEHVSGWHLPRSVGVPPPDAAGTAQAGPLGVLAVLWQATRSGREQPGFFGISASTGSYRFLDLPRLAGPTDVSLSPDGQTIAYWTTGPLRGDPIRYAGVDGIGPVDGIALYDTRTGRARFHPIRSRHGLLPEGIRWADTSQALFEFARIRTATSASGGGTVLWHRAVGPVPAPGAPELTGWTAGIGGANVIPAGRRYAVLPVGATDARRARPLPPLPRRAWTQVTTDGRAVAAVRSGPRPGRFTDAATLMIGHLAHGRIGPMRAVTEAAVGDLVGWRRPGHLLVVTAPRSSPFSARLVDVDTATAQMRTIGTVSNPQQWPGGPQYAVGLVDDGLVTRPVPALPRDGGSPLVWGAGAAALAAAVLLLLRRRRALR